MKKILALLTITALLTGGTIAMSNELEQPFKKEKLTLTINTLQEPLILQD